VEFEGLLRARARLAAPRGATNSPRFLNPPVGHLRFTGAAEPFRAVLINAATNCRRRSYFPILANKIERKSRAVKSFPSLGLTKGGLEYP